MNNKKILIAEDVLTNSILLKRILARAGYEIYSVTNGVDALKYLEQEHFDVLLTDWMMPKMDGIELIRRVRERISPSPFIIMLTALVSDNARNYAIESGADDFATKPVDVEFLLRRLDEGLYGTKEETEENNDIPIENQAAAKPPFASAAFATSTGGPPALIEIFRSIPQDIRAAFYVVQHGPSWMLETFAMRLQKETSLKVRLPFEEVISEPGYIYIAPGDKHLLVEPGTFRIILSDAPKENFVRPAADPLFRSIADAFGQYSLAVVLTGLGKDGQKGAEYLADRQGTVIVQDPNTAVAPSMPKCVIDSGKYHQKVHLTELGPTICKKLKEMEAGLLYG